MWRRRIRRFTAGGRWTEQLPISVRKNLRWFWFDGVFANASEGIVVTYLSLFVLALGATGTQIGLMSAFSSLVAALVLLPGAGLVERWGHRRQIVVFSGGGISRLMLLLLALLPLFFSGPAAIAIAIGLVVVRSASGNFSYPAWMSLSADIVPLAWRGRYFSSRNIMMSLAGMTTAFGAGLIITRVGGVPGYQVALGLAFLIGLGATYSYNRLCDPRNSAPTPRPAPQTRSIRERLGEDAAFWILCATAALWNFSLNIAGPFFSVYLVTGLEATAIMVGTLTVVNSLAALPGQRLFGVLADRWGPRRVQLVTGLLIPLMPVGWALVGSTWQLIPVEIAAGFLWAGYNLAIFNFLLTLMPEGQRERYSAIYQIIITLALAGGAAVGGVIVGYWGYKAVFITSAIGRLIAALLFARFSRQAVAT
jgi:MFS family permease